MKILILSTYDFRGGAARAAFRLCTDLRKRGHEAHMLVQFRDTSEEFVEVPDSLVYKYFPSLRSYADLLPPMIKRGEKVLFSSANVRSDKVTEFIRKFDPDLVHVHWINKGFVRLESIPEFGKPLVWTLHDMWPFTGGCHIPNGCLKYREQCGACPILGSSKEKDMSRENHIRKTDVYRRLVNVVFTAPSKWMRQVSLESSLLRDAHIITAPNGIDTGIFNTEQPETKKAPAGVSPKSSLLLFGALRSTELKVKGYDLLKEALNYITTGNVELVVFGGERKEPEMIGEIRVHHIGYVENESELADLYRAADITVMPSRMESFGQVATESMACGTPVVAFGHAGLLDIVDHMENGYLARPYSTRDLADGIDAILQSERYAEISHNAVRKVHENFSGEKVCAKFEQIYRKRMNPS